MVGHGHQGLDRPFVRALAPRDRGAETWETATFRVTSKIFLMFSEQERHAWIKSVHDEQRALVAMDPGAWFVPPYVGPSGWVGAVLSKADGDRCASCIVEAWRMTAPARLVSVFDEQEA